MRGAWQVALVTAFAWLAITATSSADDVVLQQKQPPKVPKSKPPKVSPKSLKDSKPSEKKEQSDLRVLIRRPPSVIIDPWQTYAHAYGVWPGPVLPGMWGNAWGGLWPNSWWMGGPYLYSGWVGTWDRGWSVKGGEDGYWGHSGSGAHPWLLPPVFNPTLYPATSPYWIPIRAPHWMVPAAAPPAVLSKSESPKPRELRAVAVGASAEKLFANALWLYFDDNFASARDHLAAAVKQSPRDARYWYYKALSERALGDQKAARESAETGAALEIVGATERRAILTVLERIQGADRAFINDLVSGPKALTLSKANDIVAGLKPAEATSVTSAK